MELEVLLLDSRVWDKILYVVDNKCGAIVGSFHCFGNFVTYSKENKYVYGS
jgi:hypothetical protein